MAGSHRLWGAFLPAA